MVYFFIMPQLHSLSIVALHAVYSLCRILEGYIPISMDYIFSFLFLSKFIFSYGQNALVLTFYLHEEIYFLKNQTTDNSYLPFLSMSQQLLLGCQHLQLSQYQQIQTFTPSINQYTQQQSSIINLQSTSYKLPNNMIPSIDLNQINTLNQRMFKRLCSNHKDKNANYLCLQPNCKNDRLSCENCFEFQKHLNHQKSSFEVGSKECIFTIRYNHFQREQKDLRQHKIKILQKLANKKQQWQKSMDRFVNLYQEHLSWVRLMIQMDGEESAGPKAIDKIKRSGKPQEIEQIYKVFSCLSSQQLTIYYNQKQQLQQKMKQIHKQLSNINDFILQQIKHIQRAPQFNFAPIQNQQQEKKQQIKTLSNILQSQSNEINKLVNQNQLRLIGNRAFPRWEANIQQNIKHIPFLKSLENIKSLCFNGNQIKNITNLDNLINLKELYLGWNQIQKIQNLQNLQNLIILGLSNNHISRIEGLDKLNFLQKLGLNDNKITKIQGISHLSKLSVLNLAKNEITKLQGLQTLQSLSIFGLKKNMIQQINHLSELKCLTSLDLSHNNIKDIQILKELKKLKTVWLNHNDLQNSLQNKRTIIMLRNKGIALHK